MCKQPSHGHQSINTAAAQCQPHVHGVGTCVCTCSSLNQQEMIVLGTAVLWSPWGELCSWVKSAEKLEMLRLKGGVGCCLGKILWACFEWRRGLQHQCAQGFFSMWMFQRSSSLLLNPTLLAMKSIFCLSLHTQPIVLVAVKQNLSFWQIFVVY